MDWLDYREALDIGFSDHDKVEFFMTKMFNILEDNDWSMRGQINEDEYFSFCNTTGSKYVSGDYPVSRYGKIINVLKYHSHSLNDFLAYYIAFINCQKDRPEKEWTRENFKNILCNMLDGAHILFELREDKDGYFIFPKGARELDDALVSEPLEWLSSYPYAQKAFIKALRNYANLTDDNASDTADLFRKALETFFHEFFGTDKTLENCKAIYGEYLKAQGIPTELVKNFETLQQMYTTYMNAYAKHHDKTGKNALEYIMYQTGNIIRLLITLKQDEK